MVLEKKEYNQESTGVLQGLHRIFFGIVWVF